MTFDMKQFESDIEGTILEDILDMPYICSDQPDNADELRETIERYISEHEVIYYHNAMKYLLENDPSLTESLELAHDCGYSVNKLNSETLATIHMQNAAMEQIPDLEQYFTDEE